jgi:putative tryptophan/tyrosine transport system substrate-binding protein
MKRRAFALGLAGLVLPLGRVVAQEADRLPKVAILSPATPEHAQHPGPPLNTLLRSLEDLGYVDGQNVSLEFRFASHALERLPSLAAELVATQPDVIWTWTSGGARAVAAATSTVPIVVGPVNEATMASLVANFARPAGNVTGLTLNSREQHEKCLQLLKEVAPGTTRVGVLVNPLNPAWSNYPEILNDAARALEIELVRLEARGAEEVERAFALAASRNVDALFGLADSTLVGADPTPARLLELITEMRLPSISDDTDFAGEGGLLSLGPDFTAIARGAALYVHRILQGAKPGDLPVELPRRFQLIANLKAAEQLGIEIPQSVLLRADEVIE